MTISNNSFALALFTAGCLPLIILIGMFWDWKTVVKTYSQPLLGSSSFVLYGLLPLSCMALVALALIGWREAARVWINETPNP